MLVEDYHNFSIEKCKDLIKKYQEIKDTYTRDLLLAKFDKYLLHVVYALRKRYVYLRGEDLQGLYHTAVLGFYKALDVFDCTLPAYMIFFVIRSYIRNELDIFYAYKAKELQPFEPAIRFEDLKLGHDKKKLETFYTNFSVLLLIDHPSLNEKERTFLTGIYCKGYSRKEMAAEYGCSAGTVHFHMKSAIRKLKKALFQSGEMVGKKIEERPVK